MRPLRTTLAIAALLALFGAFASAPVPASGAELVRAYDTELRMVFSLGYGPKSVREEDFGKFVREVVAPVFKEGCMVLDARGQWVHPVRGLVRERNSVLVMQYLAGGDDIESRQDNLAREFLRRFPGSNASVHVTRAPISSVTVYSQ